VDGGEVVGTVSAVVVTGAVVDGAVVGRSVVVVGAVVVVVGAIVVGPVVADTVVVGSGSVEVGAVTGAVVLVGRRTVGRITTVPNTVVGIDVDVVLVASSSLVVVVGSATRDDTTAAVVEARVEATVAGFGGAVDSRVAVVTVVCGVRGFSARFPSARAVTIIKAPKSANPVRTAEVRRLRRTSVSPSSISCAASGAEVGTVPTTPKAALHCSQWARCRSTFSWSPALKEPLAHAVIRCRHKRQASVCSDLPGSTTSVMRTLLPFVSCISRTPQGNQLYTPEFCVCKDTIKTSGGSGDGHDLKRNASSSALKNSSSSLTTSR
jgi:hypothetical protein